MQFSPIKIAAGSKPEDVLRIWRLNSLGSLYFFVKVALRRKRLTDNLHWRMCQDLEKEHLKDVYEMPRDHFKSTICTEGLPMWKALPFSNEDEDLLRLMGYDDSYIQWMRFAHNPDTRILLVSENITNAAKLGSRIRWHFESNALYRTLFPETIPDTSCTWTNFSLHVKRPNVSTAGHGEGTFDFLGVGGALQSRHYPGGIIEDDIVGRKAIESNVVMDSTIEYHKLLIGAFEDEDPTHEGNELVVGNRWGFHDLNSHIREHEPWFRITTHSAMGGCCSEHPAGFPIFPEEFSESKLARIRERQGSYTYSCQYLNNPVSPEDADFKEAWLVYYDLLEDINGRKYVRHRVVDGKVIPSVFINEMSIGVMADPNHAGQYGRARHAIVVAGRASNGYTYVLDTWAEACAHEKFFNKLYEIARKWKKHKVGLETIAAQKFAETFINYRNIYEPWGLRVIPLKGEIAAPDGTTTRKKEWRIRNIIAPIAESCKLCVQPSMQDFIGEYVSFPRGRYCDQLDAFAYINQVISNNVIPMAEDANRLAANRRGAGQVNAPYSQEELRSIW